ncbi:hypothetical protein RRG08_010465 [Elysia crispata]|uniref:Uncharacterized protein n=1 Tax=Elysia crispata TaxID=231223 RepID=A0AAE1APS0_9GAST|nr:hypothetical protein RRG08_010465 [Elysia crispata]
MDWPAFSPDMSPTVHLWDELNSQVPFFGHQDRLDQLQNAPTWQWIEIPHNFIQQLISSMSRRILACIETAGGATRY